MDVAERAREKQRELQARLAVRDLEDSLIGWAMNDLDRDRVVLAALAGGISKNRVHKLTGIARTTIDRISSAD